MKRPRPAKALSTIKKSAADFDRTSPSGSNPAYSAKLARGIRAGRWLFATGQSGTDYVNGLAPEVVQADHPLNGESQAKRESRRLFRNVEEVLGEVGAGFPDVVRIDQYYTSARAMHPYHEVRREVFKGTIPPSTSNLHQRSRSPDNRSKRRSWRRYRARASRPSTRRLRRATRYHLSGYSPGLSAGDFRFIPGQTAKRARRMKARSIRSSAARARSGEWPIKLETDFIISARWRNVARRRWRESRRVVKAQVYLSDRDDVPGFNEVWRTHFKTPPATTIIATSSPGFTMPDLRIEINAISLATRARRSAR